LLIETEKHFRHRKSRITSTIFLRRKMPHYNSSNKAFLSQANRGQAV
jgi:hypothetical protein